MKTPERSSVKGYALTLLSFLYASSITLHNIIVLVNNPSMQPDERVTLLNTIPTAWLIPLVLLITNNIRLNNRKN